MILFDLVNKNGSLIFGEFCKDCGGEPKKGYIRFRRPYPSEEKGVFGPEYVLYKGKIYTELDFQHRVQDGRIILPDVS